MYKKSKEKSELILQLYKDGVLLNEISEQTSSSTVTVKKVLSHFGIDYNLVKATEYQDKLKQVITLYKEGKSQTYIETTLKLTRKTIRELLKSENIEYRSKSEQQHIRCNTVIDHNCLDELTPEALYWIGLLYADGHIEKKEHSIELTLHKDDNQHLELCKQFLKTNRNVSKGHGDCDRLRFNSERLWNRLKELGFTHDKSYTAKPHSNLKNSRDFWRGVVDGDGGIYFYPTNKTHYQITLCGTLETIFDFIIFCSRECKIKDKYPSRAHKNDILYQVHYYDNNAIKVANLLYKDATIYLERKYNKYQQIIKDNSNQ